MKALNPTQKTNILLIISASKGEKVRISKQGLIKTTHATWKLQTT